MFLSTTTFRRPAPRFSSLLLSLQRPYLSKLSHSPFSCFSNNTIKFTETEFYDLTKKGIEKGLYYEPSFQNREQSTKLAFAGMYGSVFGIMDKPMQSRLYNTFFLSQYFGAGKTRFISEFKHQVYEMRGVLKEDLETKRPYQESRFDALLNARHVSIDCQKLRLGSYTIDGRVSTFLVEEISEHLQVNAKTDDLHKPFLDYIKKHKVSPSKPRVVILYLDEFTVEAVTGKPDFQSDQDRDKVLYNFWESTYVCAKDCIGRGLGVVWVFSGRDYGFWSIQGTGSRGSPTSTHWILLESLKTNHVKNIVSDLERSGDIRNNIVHPSAKDCFLEYLTQFTGGVPRSICIILGVLNELGVKDLQDLETIENLFEKVTVAYSNTISKDFLGSFNTEKTMSKVVVKAKLYEQYQVSFDPQRNWDLGKTGMTEAQVLNKFPVFLGTTRGTSHLVVPPMNIVGLKNLVPNKYLGFGLGLAEVSRYLPRQAIDSGTLLETCLLFGITHHCSFHFYLGGENTFRWLEQNHQGEIKPFRKLVNNLNLRVEKGKDWDALENIMETDTYTLIWPKPGARSGDLYMKFKTFGLSVQAKNEKRNTTWNTIKEEVEKLGKFAIPMYYVYSAMNITPKLNSMIPEDETFLKLRQGTYYYDATAKDYGWLLHKDLDGTYRLLVNTYSFTVQKQSKSTESCLKLGEDILDCEEYNLKQIQSHISATHVIRVPQNTYLIVLGEKGMQDIIGKDSFEDLLNRLNRKQYDNIPQLLEHLITVHK